MSGRHSRPPLAPPGRPRRCWHLGAAAVVGLLLILRGSLDLVTSLFSRDINPTWWLGLITGILEILIGFWASQQAFPARAALVIFFAGFFALFRGIADIVLAFELRSSTHA